MKLKAYDKDLDKWFDVSRIDFDNKGDVAQVMIIFAEGYNYKFLGSGVELKWHIEPDDRVIKIMPPIEDIMDTIKRTGLSIEELDARKMMDENKLKELAESGD